MGTKTVELGWVRQGRLGRRMSSGSEVSAGDGMWHRGQNPSGGWLFGAQEFSGVTYVSDA